MDKIKNNIFTNKIVVCIIAIICCGLWGSAFPFVKIGYNLFNITNTSSQILFAGLRFTIAGIMTIIIGSILNKKILFPKKTSWIYVANLSFFQTFVQYLFFYIGLSITTGVKASLIEGTCAFFSILIASLIFKQEKLTWLKISACIIGFGGVIISNVNGVSFETGLAGDLMICVSTISYAFSSVLIKKYSQEENPVTLSGYQFFIGGLVLSAVGLFMGGQLTKFTIESMSVLLYLGLLSAIAYSLWGIILKHNKVSNVTVYSFMIPVFGVILSALLLESERGGAFKTENIIALILVSVGIVIINKFSDKR